MKTGVVTRLSDRGFGFIEPDDKRDRDMYFHTSGMALECRFDDLRRGDRVEYICGFDERRGRTMATQVMFL